MTLQVVIGGLDLTALEASGVQWSTHVLDGWLGSPTTTLQPVQKPRQSGSWGGLAYNPSRHMVLTGLVVAPSQDALIDAIERLNAAVALSDTLLSVVDGALSRHITVRRSDEVIPRYITSNMAEWSIQVIALDPRKLGTSLTDDTNLPATSGGLTIPFTIPFTISSTVVSGQVSLTNPGNVAGPVMLRIDGPCVGPVITHTSSSTTAAMVFSSSLTLGVGEFLLVDMDAHTVMANGQSTRRGYLTSAGWSLFDPGMNTWSFTASGYNAASLLTVTATPAWS